jgi:hypothetical protein
MEQGVSVITLGVGNLERSREFYEDCESWYYRQTRKKMIGPFRVVLATIVLSLLGAHGVSAQEDACRRRLWEHRRELTR